MYPYSQKKRENNILLVCVVFLYHHNLLYDINFDSPVNFLSQNLKFMTFRQTLVI